MNQIPGDIAGKDVSDIDLVILGRGVNDINSGQVTTVAQMLARVATAKAAYPAGQKFILPTIPPFKTGLPIEPSWTQAKQDIADAYSDEILSNPPNGCIVVDIKPILDADGDDILDPPYQIALGDIHPNGTGSQALAEFYANQIYSRCC